MTETDVETPAAPASEPRRWDWRPKVRWFAAEYFIVVLGVLTAVALNAWWTDRGDAQQAVAYLQRLTEDLRADTTALAQQEQNSALKLAWTRRMINVVEGTDSLPASEPDSFVVMLERIGRWAPARINRHTYRDLLSSGNMNLVRAPELRERIRTYYDNAALLEELQALYTDRIWNDALAAAVEALPVDLQTSLMISGDVAGISVTPEEARSILQRLREVPRLEYRLKNTHRSYFFLVRFSSRTRDEAAELIQAIEDYLK